MKKLVFILLISFLSLSFYAQDNEINIKNTSIQNADIQDFGTIDQMSYKKLIINNQRSTVVIIKNIITPDGFFANISDMEIKPGKNAVLYIGIDPNWTTINGEFQDTIKIKTNLIKDIIIPVKGKITKENN